MKMQNEGQPIQLARKEQRWVYDKTYCEKNKEKGRADNKQYREEFKMKKQNPGKKIQLRRREKHKCLGSAKWKFFMRMQSLNILLATLSTYVGNVVHLHFKMNNTETLTKNQKMCLSHCAVHMALFRFHLYQSLLHSSEHC